MTARKYTTILTLLLSIFSLSGISQDCYQKPSGDKGLANDYFSAYGSYGCALKEYLIIYADKPKDKKINRRIAQCYLRMSGGNKAMAIKYLNFLTNDPKVDDEVYFELGQAHLYDNNNEEAIKLFKKFIEIATPSGEEKVIVDKFIQYANNSTQLQKHPLDVKFENMGKGINSDYNDYLPYTTETEDFIAFSTNRKGTTGRIEDGDGFTSDVFIGKLKKGRDKYSKPRSIGGMFNTEYNDEVAGGSADGSYFFFNSDADFQILNLKYSYKAPKKRSYPKPENLDGINQKNSNEISATITNDGNLIIFASDRKEGYGGFDLWMARRLPNQSWGIPMNLGPTINSKFDELYPMFNTDQNTIYFSSNGHFSIGGFDLFETTFSEEIKTWTAPRNLGYPINTAYDDYNIIFTNNGRNAYKSAVRRDSRGMKDIYRLTLGSAIPRYTIVKGNVLADTLVNITEIKEKANTITTQKQGVLDSLVVVQADSLVIDEAKKELEALQLKQNLVDPFTLNEIEATKDGVLYGKYTPNSRNGKFIMILEPGSYSIKLYNEGFEPISMKIKIFDKSNFTPELKRDFYLKPKVTL
jgi:hypothetical protein